MATSEQKRRRGSILDLVLIFLLILSVLGIAFRWQQLKGMTAQVQYKEYRLSGQIRSLDPAVLECITDGEALYNASGEYFGQIGSVRATPSRVRLFSNGVYQEAEWDPEQQIDLAVEILFDGTERDGRILWRGRGEVMVGQALTLYSEYATLHLRVHSVMPNAE